MSNRIAIVGVGRLGSCLARALHSEQLGLTTLASARLESAQRLAAELGARAAPLERVCDHADLVVIAVPDAAVHAVSSALSPTGAHAVVHTSGALDLSVLESARTRGARVGVFHPLQAFPSAAAASRFSGIHIGIEAESGLERELSAIAHKLGATPFSLAGIDRAGYHAAAVFASNYVVALHATAAAIWQRAGLPGDTARAALLPLTRGAVDAIAEHDLVGALTGPLARADLATLERHLQVLACDPASERLYRALAGALLRLPLVLEPELRARLQRLVEPGS